MSILLQNTFRSFKVQVLDYFLRKPLKLSTAKNILNYLLENLNENNRRKPKLQLKKLLKLMKRQQDVHRKCIGHTNKSDKSNKKLGIVTDNFLHNRLHENSFCNTHLRNFSNKCGQTFYLFKENPALTHVKPKTTDFVRNITWIRYKSEDGVKVFCFPLTKLNQSLTNSTKLFENCLDPQHQCVKIQQKELKPSLRSSFIVRIKTLSFKNFPLQSRFKTVSKIATELRLKSLTKLEFLTKVRLFNYPSEFENDLEIEETKQRIFNIKKQLNKRYKFPKEKVLTIPEKIWKENETIKLNTNVSERHHMSPPSETKENVKPGSYLNEFELRIINYVPYERRKFERQPLKLPKSFELDETLPETGALKPINFVSKVISAKGSKVLRLLTKKFHTSPRHNIRLIQKSFQRNSVAYFSKTTNPLFDKDGKDNDLEIVDQQNAADVESPYAISYDAAVSAEEELEDFEENVVSEDGELADAETSINVEDGARTDEEVHKEEFDEIDRIEDAKKNEEAPVDVITGVDDDDDSVVNKDGEFDIPPIKKFDSLDTNKTPLYNIYINDDFKIHLNYPTGFFNLFETLFVWEKFFKSSDLNTLIRKNKYFLYKILSRTGTTLQENYHLESQSYFDRELLPLSNCTALPNSVIQVVGKSPKSYLEKENVCLQNKNTFCSCSGDKDPPKDPDEPSYRNGIFKNLSHTLISDPEFETSIVKFCGTEYKNQQYFLYHCYSFYDLYNYMACMRLVDTHVPWPPSCKL